MSLASPKLPKALFGSPDGLSGRPVGHTHMLRRACWNRSKQFKSLDLCWNISLLHRNKTDILVYQDMLRICNDVAEN
jgi:hypothetical protein